MADNKEQQAKNILAEDQDLTIDVGEIQRIIRLYLGREASPSELHRFIGMKESEVKILTDYANSERDTMKRQSDVMNTQHDLSHKAMKIKGNAQIDAMKNNQMPPATNSSPNQMMPTEQATPTAPPTPLAGKQIPDGRFTLVRFANGK